MLSLNNAFSPDEVRDFGGRVERAIGSVSGYVCELKIDGLAMSITYATRQLRPRRDPRQRRRGRGRHRQRAHHPLGADDAHAGGRHGFPTSSRFAARSICPRPHSPRPTRASRRRASPGTRIRATRPRARCVSSTRRSPPARGLQTFMYRHRPAGQDPDPGRGARHARGAGIPREPAPPARRVDRRGARVPRPLVGAAPRPRLRHRRRGHQGRVARGAGGARRRSRARRAGRSRTSSRPRSTRPRCSTSTSRLAARVR